MQTSDAFLLRESTCLNFIMPVGLREVSFTLNKIIFRSLDLGSSDTSDLIFLLNKKLVISRFNSIKGRSRDKRTSFEINRSLFCSASFFRSLSFALTILIHSFFIPNVNNTESISEFSFPRKWNFSHNYPIRCVMFTISCNIKIN